MLQLSHALFSVVAAAAFDGGMLALIIKKGIHHTMLMLMTPISIAVCCADAMPAIWFQEVRMTDTMCAMQPMTNFIIGNSTSIHFFLAQLLASLFAISFTVA